MVRFASATALTLAAALPFASPAQAEDFEPPVGCETFLTVQSRACVVSNLYRCAATTDGSFWEAMYSPVGLESLVSYSDSYQWLDSRYTWDASREVLIEPAEDPIDKAALANDGVDTFRFRMHRTSPVEDREITVVGADVLTGETAMIDGFTLDLVRTQLQILSDDGTVEYQSRGTQYFDRDRGLFFLGEDEVIDLDGTATILDGSPVDIIEPNEPGFASTFPLYECDQQKAGFVPAPAAPAPGQKEMNHDQI